MRPLKPSRKWYKPERRPGAKFGESTRGLRAFWFRDLRYAFADHLHGK